jgi:predicted nucleic acid-binding protein
VDSSAWIALADRSDQHHGRAAAWLEALGGGSRLHTSNYVVAETVTRLRRQAGLRIALRWVEDLLRSRVVSVHCADAGMDEEAVGVLRKYRDQELSFPDCSSIVLLRRLRIDRIFAFDDDFRRLGFEVVPVA